MSMQDGVRGDAKAAGERADGAPRPAALRVRPAGPADEAPLVFFFDAVLRKDYFMRRGQLSEILIGTRHRVFIAEIDDVLVGVAILTANTRLVNALVHPAYRGLGIGRALIEHSGAREVRAKLDMSTGDPRGFYRSLGFTSTGRRNAKGNIELMRKRGPGPARSGGAASQRADSGVSRDETDKARCDGERKKQNRTSAA